MMNEPYEIDPHILRIRKIAGKIGGTQNIENGSDAENYEYQVDVGLAEAVAEIQELDPSKLIFWFGYCLIQLGTDCNDRIAALLDALEREVYEQLDENFKDAA